MKHNKTEIVQRRQRILVAAALILGILAGCTGFLGFASGPAEDHPEAVTAPSVTDPEEPTDVPDPTSPFDPEKLTDMPAPASPSDPEKPADVSEPTPPKASSSRDTLSGGTNAFPSEGLQNMPRLYLRIACCVFLALLAADLWMLYALRKNVRKHAQTEQNKTDRYRPTKVSLISITQKKVEKPAYPIPGITLGKVHDMGKREYQQDSFGQSPVLNNAGILAVLADGMGGLSNGERVSQKIIMEALNFAVGIQANQIPNALPDMVETVNRAVNQMLGPEGLYASGSTLVSALIVNDALWWISVGDSRVYLYRDSRLNQLSRDHDLFQDWMPDILSGKRSMDEAVKNPDGRKLTSFIGMGNLRYVDRNRSAIPLLPGDRVLLMSDGIYGTVSDGEMANILQNSVNVQDAASQIANKISAAALPYQDNYTLIILGYDPPTNHGL